MSTITQGIVVAAYGLLAFLLAATASDALGIQALGPHGALLGLLLFIGCAVVHEGALRRRSLREFKSLLRDFKIADVRNAEGIESLRREIIALRRHQEGVEKDTLERYDGEIQVVKSLLGQLADRLTRRGPRAGGPAGKLAAATPAAAASPAVGSLDLEPAELLAAVREALEENRVDLYLQPVVTLPQRKVRYYESFSRIRHRDGGILLPNQYLALAAEHGLLTAIDNLLLFQCVQLIRRARGRNRHVGFFVNMSVRSLGDAAFIDQFLDFLERNPDLADSLYFEFAQTDLAAMEEAAAQALGRLARAGFRFSLDQVQSLDFDCAGLAERSFRFVRIEAAMLLSDVERHGADIDVADLKEALARHGIELIAEKVEQEATVVDLLDLAVDYAQGYLFGEPRRRRDEGATPALSPAGD